MTVAEIVSSYLSFFEKRGHKQVQNSSLVPLNDPTTLFTSSGMQPLIPYLLGESHPSGSRLINVQNCFRAADIDEVGDNRHTTFFRMLGNWSLGDYFKREQLSWFFEFLTKELKLDPKRLYVSVFEGYKNIPKDEESAEIWRELFKKENIDPEGRIFYCGVDDNWWSRSGTPDKMPSGEPGGPDSEVYFDLRPQGGEVKGGFKKLSDNGRLLEIGNSVFMEYIKKEDGGFAKLPKSNVDFGGGLERLVAATEDKGDIFETSLFAPIIKTISEVSNKKYEENEKAMRIVADHFVAGIFIAREGIKPSNKEQGYLLRRLIRRGLDNLYSLGGDDISPILEKIVEQYSPTDPDLGEKFETIKLVFEEEKSAYKKTVDSAKNYISKKYKKIGDELLGTKEISAEDAFALYSTHGLSPSQIRSLGYTFDEQTFAEKIKEHQSLSRVGAAQKFSGGLRDHEELTVKGHTATHLLHQALRDVLGNSVHQTGSNITSERLRFDFSYDKKLSEDEFKKVEEIVLSKIEDNFPVRFEIMSLDEAKKIGAIGLFDEKYGNDVKVYFIGSSTGSGQDGYSKEFCGGPHVNFTGDIKSFKIIKEEGAGKNTRRIYAKVT